MRRNALFIETIMELLSPVLHVRQVYMNISYMKDEMVDYMDSPVPYIIGMSDVQWERFGQTKWEKYCAEQDDDIVILRLDGNQPTLMSHGDRTQAPKHSSELFL